MSDVVTAVTVDHVFHATVDGEQLDTQPNSTFGHRLDWFENCSLCVQAAAPDPFAAAREAKREIAERDEIVFACRTGRHPDVVAYCYCGPACRKNHEAFCCGRTMRRVKAA